MIVNDSLIIDLFEKAVARYCGSKYGVAVSSQTNAIFLCFELLKMHGKLLEGSVIDVPKRTYMSVHMTVLNTRCKINFVDNKWSGCYQLTPTNIWDSAVKFTKDMYVKDSLFCVSFQYKKSLPIGRGGMVLLDDKADYELLKKLRFNGRTDGITQEEDYFTVKGWNMYMTPEQAARGLSLLSTIGDCNDDIASYINYPDVSGQVVFK